jgi:hypothetical protein
VPKLKWYEREKSYHISVNATTPDESTGADLDNNDVSRDVSVKHQTQPAYFSAAIVLVGLIFLILIFTRVRDFSKLQPTGKFLSFVFISLVLGIMLGAVFLLPLGSSGIPVLCALLIVPPLFVLFTYFRTKSIFITLVCSIITPLVFGVTVGAGSGGMDYVGNVFTETALVSYGYSVYVGLVIAMALIYGIFAKRLWTYAGREIMRVEMKIKNLKGA